MATVRVEYQGKVISYQAKEGLTLLEVLQALGADIAFPCGGNHTCGKCRVAAAGHLSPMEESEAQLLAGAGPGIRLACFAQVAGDCELKVLGEKTGERIAQDYAAGSSLDPLYSAGYGIAVDIGTTTAVGYLFSHQRQAPLAVLGEMNRQQAFGADVLSRIDYCNQHTVQPLCQLIREQISGIAVRLCAKAGIDPEQVACFCIAGNTTMLHLLAGLPPRSLALAPFTPVSLFGDWQDWRLAGFEQAEIFLPPCIAAYIGADITCSILASGIARQPETVLLVDIGTNGEMALNTAGRMVACSTAAGPAFEGAGISSGTSAHQGAISAVWPEQGALAYRTIDDAPAVGVCGSGLIDAISAMHQLGVIDHSGRMDPGLNQACLIGGSGVSLTQADIRAFQLAKAAIRGGMDTLIHECGLTYGDLRQIVLCGGFGSNIDVRSAEGVGLIPPGFAGKTKAIGNAAGAGAGQILQSRLALEEALRIAAATEAIELSYSKYFMDRYIQSMGFGE